MCCPLPPRTTIRLLEMSSLRWNSGLLSRLFKPTIIQTRQLAASIMATKSPLSRFPEQKLFSTSETVSQSSALFQLRSEEIFTPCPQLNMFVPGLPSKVHQPQLSRRQLTKSASSPISEGAKAMAGWCWCECKPWVVPQRKGEPTPPPHWPASLRADRGSKIKSSCSL